MPYNIDQYCNDNWKNEDNNKDPKNYKNKFIKKASKKLHTEESAILLAVNKLLNKEPLLLGLFSFFYILEYYLLFIDIYF